MLSHWYFLQIFFMNSNATWKIHISTTEDWEFITCNGSGQHKMIMKMNINLTDLIGESLRYDEEDQFLLL